MGLTLKQKCDRLREENADLKARMEGIRAALLPVEFEDYGEIIKRHERRVFNEGRLQASLGTDGQTVLVIWARYKNALIALNGGGT